MQPRKLITTALCNTSIVSAGEVIFWAKSKRHLDHVQKSRQEHRRNAPLLRASQVQLPDGNQRQTNDVCVRNDTQCSQGIRYLQLRVSSREYIEEHGIRIKHSADYNPCPYTYLDGTVLREKAEIE